MIRLLISKSEQTILLILPILNTTQYDLFVLQSVHSLSLFTQHLLYQVIWVLQGYLLLVVISILLFLLFLYLFFFFFLYLFILFFLYLFIIFFFYLFILLFIILVFLLYIVLLLMLFLFNLQPLAIIFSLYTPLSLIPLFLHILINNIYFAALLFLFVFVTIAIHLCCAFSIGFITFCVWGLLAILFLYIFLLHCCFLFVIVLLYSLDQFLDTWQHTFLGRHIELDYLLIILAKLITNMFLLQFEYLFIIYTFILMIIIILLILTYIRASSWNSCTYRHCLLVHSMFFRKYWQYLVVPYEAFIVRSLKLQLSILYY